MKKSLFLIPLLTLIMSSCSCACAQKTNPSGSGSGGSSTSQPTNLPEVVSVTLNKSNIEFNLLDDNPTDTLTASVEVRNGAPTTFNFSSSNENVATINEQGLVRAVGTGYSVVRATSTFDNTKYAECSVRVISPKNYSFDPTSVTSIGENEYSYKATSGSESIDLVIDGAEYIAGQFKVEGEAYFYNVSPMGGINNASYTVEGSGSNFIASSFLSRNPLTWDNILGSKYSDLFAYVASNDDVVYVYGSRNVTMDQTRMPSLKNYAYFMIHLKVLSNPIYITMMSATNDGANLPTIPVGENQGLFSQEEISDIRNKTNNSISPSKMGNGAYCVEPYEYFGINQFVSLNQRSYFETDLINNGYILGMSQTYGGAEGYYYQKQIGSIYHTFVIVYQNYAHFRLVDISYRTDLGPMARTTTWPSEFLNEHLKEQYASIIPELSSNKIEAFECARTSNQEVLQIGILAVIKEGETFSEAELKAYLDLYNNSPNFYNYHSLDGLFAFQAFLETDRVILNFAQYPKYDVAPSKELIANNLRYDNKEDIATFDGGENAYYTYATQSVSGYFTYSVFNVSEDAIKDFEDSLESYGYTYINNSYRKEVDIFGSYVSISIYNSSVPNSYTFYYSFSEMQSYYSEVSSFADLVEMWDNHYYDDDVIDELNAFTTLDSYSYFAREYSDVYIILGAGDEFIAQLEAIKTNGLTQVGLYYLDTTNQFLIVKQSDEGLMIRFWYGSFDANKAYTYFNDAMTYWGASDLAKFYLSDEDELPNQFTEEGKFYGSLEEVTNFSNLLVSKLSGTGRYKYSRYLDQYFVITSEYYLELRIQEKFFDGSGVYYLDVKFGSDGIYEEYQAYDDYDDTKLDIVINFIAHFPELPFVKSDKIIANLEANEQYMSFDVEGDDTSYNNRLVNNGFSTYSGEGYYKIIDNHIYVASLTKNARNVTYYFRDFGEALNSESLYNYDGNKYHAFLDEFSFANYFVSTSKVYALLDASENKTFSFATVYETEVVDYFNHIHDLGFEPKEIDEYIKYTNEERTNYLYVKRESSHGVNKITFEKVEHIEWYDLVSSLTSFDYNSYIDKVEWPSIYSGQEIFLLESESADTLSFKILNNDIDINSYIEAIQNHAEYYDSDIQENVFIFYFSDESRITINTGSEEYISVEIYIKTSH